MGTIVNADHTDHASWIHEIIVVVGSNHKIYSPNGLRSSGRRGDDLPHPRSSDHWPVGLRWSGAKKKRNLQIHLTTSFTDLYHRGCLITAVFQRVADECFDSRFANRDSGLAGLSSFVGTMHDCATKFLSTHVIVTTTARQRLELALAAMRLSEPHPIGERRLSRLCAADCDLSAIIELHVNLDVFDSTSVPLHVLERWAERCRVQADAVLVETNARPDILSDPAEGFRGHRQHESTLQSLKRLKQGTPLAVNELWDAHDGIFIDDTARMAKLIQDAAQDWQGRVTSSLCMARICLTNGIPISANVASLSSAMKLRISF